jgi:hypothetical protein
MKIIQNFANLSLLKLDEVSKDFISLQYDILSLNTIKIQRLDGVIDTSSIQKFLDQLDKDKLYVVSASLILGDGPSEITPKIILSSDILVSYLSNSLLIRDYLTEQIIKALKNLDLKKYDGDLDLKYRQALLR